MSERIIHRPARIEAPLTRPDPKTIAAPPQQGDAVPGGIPLRTLLPVFGSLSSIIMIVVLRANPIMVVVGALVLTIALVGGIGMAVGQRGQAARARRRERERYLDYLEKLRAELRTEHDAVRAEAVRTHPSPDQLTAVLRDPERIWQRRRRDADFLQVRVGTGSIDWFDLQLPGESTPVQPFDPIMDAEAHALIASHRAITGMPATIPLRSTGVVSVVGDPEHTLALVRSMLAQLTSAHAPEDLQIGLASPPDNIRGFGGFDLLPHALMDAWDGPVQARRIAPSSQELAAVIRDELTARVVRATARLRNGNSTAVAERPLVIVLDDTARTASSFPLPEGFSPEQLGIVVISIVRDRLHEPSDTEIRLTITDHGSGPVMRIDAPPAAGAAADSVRPDTLRTTLFEGFASRIAPLRLSAASRAQDVGAEELNTLDLLGIDSVSDVAPPHWRHRSMKDFLRVPVAVGDDGERVHIDLKESAHGGMGPHGICIGATGSGKSEFLRTLVLSLAITHSPDDLAMILVDYKGGAAFTPFQPLPHIAGLIDNLADDAQLIERARASIEGEIVRRQRLLKNTGSYASITEYRAARDAHPELPALPHLLLVIDEFGELLTAEPDFIDLLLQIGRIGRALGIHLLLSSQRIEGGRLRGLDTYLSYRIGLRTFSEQESSVILETPDAFHLPPIPGFGYLKVDTTVYTRFKAGYVSGPLPNRRQNPGADDIGWEPFSLPTYNTIEESHAAADVPLSSTGQGSGQTLLDESVARLRDGVPPTSPIWLPPLPDRLPLFQILDRDHLPALHIPIGVLDEPSRQAQGPWQLDLTRSGGHHAIIGAPQTGRTTFLRTLTAGIASTQTPTQVTVYGLDLTGAGLLRLEDFPHVGGIATRANREQQTRLLEQLQAMIAERERLFRIHQIESLPQFRTRHAAGELPEIVSPDVVVLVDGYGLVRTEFEHLADPLADILTRGGSHGIHLVLALTRWSEVTMSLQPLIGNRIELRLNDPTESTIKRKLAETIRTSQPGRALTDQQQFGQIALPTIDVVDHDRIGDALTELARQTATSWSGPSASPIRLLPEDLDPATLPDEFDEPDMLPIGLRQDTMEPALLDLNADQHVLILGDTSSGKTTTLRQILATLIQRHTPDELVIALMEPRSQLTAAVPDDFLGGHANNITKARQLAAALAVELDKRQNDGADTTLQIVLVIDDYDVLASGGDSPLEPILPYLASSRDLRFHVILTRPVAGAARALYERAIQAVKDTGGTGIILSGERSEGPLWPGVYATHSVPGRATLVRRGQPTRLLQIANQSG